ncbi:antigenic cell wall [Colletotrichum plurivorum]|uniref:Antigenic cell wall n=1 Tax=Colletotrichum plurivorum TaxID=2175906 RepID=A0A8H6KWX1_9PEZI|nr:antigenic cell wall [Colletotrichum plurivorum]
MRLYIIIPFLLCLFDVASAQMAMPLGDAAWGRGGRDKGDKGDKGKKGGCKKGCKGKGDREPVKGGVAALQTRIGDLRTKIANANDSVVPFKGGSIKGLVGLLKVNEAVVELGDTIDLGTKTAEATEPLPANQSTVIGTSFLAIQPEINNLLTELQGKRKEFDKAGFKILDVRSLIRDSVNIQQDKAGDLGGAAMLIPNQLTKVLDASLQPIATQVLDQINANFSATVDDYKGRAGKIKIPSKAVPKLTDLLAGVARALGIGDRDRAVMAMAGQAQPLQADQAVPPTNFPNADAAIADIGQVDTAQASANVEAYVAGIRDEDFSQLGEDENDLRGIPPLVMAVLRRYEVI